MKPYLVIINHRTWIAIFIAILTTFLSFIYGINFDLDLTLISIAMIFPLVFTIRGSFRRREKALEHLSEFRSALKTLNYFLMASSELTDEQKKSITPDLLNLSNSLMHHLKNNTRDTTVIDANMHKLYLFVESNLDTIPRRLKEKIFRLLKDLHETIENVHAINIHRTPISLKAYCLVFIYIFPLIYSPTIINNVGTDKGHWIVYFIVILSQFILISLYNIQNQLEYPFDDKGLDDIQLDNFKLNR